MAGIAETLRERLRAWTFELGGPGTRARLDVVVERPPPPVRADRDQLVQVVTNLVQNALDAVKGGKGTTVTLTTDADGHYVAFSVIDDGPGLSSEKIEEGVGLSNTRLRIEQLYGGRGSLTLQPRSAMGTEAIVTVPCDRRESRERVE